MVCVRLRLGSYATDPVPVLAQLRASRPTEVILATEAPTTDAERAYLLLFEEFKPTFYHGPDLEPAEGTYDIGQLAIPEELLPVTGEYLQSLCDYTIISDVLKTPFHAPIMNTVARQQLLLDTEWPEECKNAQSIFLYPGDIFLEAFVNREWPSLRLLIYHNGDNQINYSLLIPFLDANPNVYAWVLNNTVTHTRIRSLPIGEQNRVWREGTPEYDPPVKTSRKAEREWGIVYPWCSLTNRMRPIWYEKAKLSSRRDMMIFARLPKEDYTEVLESASAVVCPPGNGYDTHRCWESLYMGAWAIVHDNAHTQCLLKEYPSLPLLPIEGPSELENIQLPESPSPFHPMLLRTYWDLLFASYIYK